MVQSDALSHRSNFYLDKDNDNEDIILLPDDLFVNLIDLDLQRRIVASDTYDLLMIGLPPTSLSYYRPMDQLKPKLISLTGQLNMSYHNKPILFYRDKCYVPKDLEIQREIVAQYHNVPTAGHPGELETYNALRAHYWWPGMCTFVKNYMKGCAFCQQFKINRHPTKLALMPIPGSTSTHPFAQISMDFITDLLPVRGLDSIFSVVDHSLTKGIILVPCSKLGATTDVTATMILNHVFKWFGLPDKIIWSRTTIRLWYVSWTYETFRHPNVTFDGLSPSNGWNNWMI